jgi:hypothetical protein
MAINLKIRDKPEDDPEMFKPADPRSLRKFVMYNAGDGVDREEIERGRKYDIPGYSDFYFIRRKSKEGKSEQLDRVCLYRKNVVVCPGEQPTDRLISNELLNGRRVKSITSLMTLKARYELTNSWYSESE